LIPKPFYIKRHFEKLVHAFFLLLIGVMNDKSDGAGKQIVYRALATEDKDLDIGNSKA
jgi:hypothetical protein